MSERTKLTSSHLRREAFVCSRQSSQAQLERNVESTARQYALVERAIELGFAREQVVVIDEDLGISGAGPSGALGFATLAAEVALGHAGLVLGLEVSRLARNNADWYRLLDLCGVTDTVIGDADGLYRPGSFNDRLLLGLKGSPSEAELHVLRARLGGAIRNKAQRGELRSALPIGAGVGRGGGRDPARSRRGGARRDRHDLGPVRGARLGPAGVAVNAPRGGCSSRCVAGRTSCGGSHRSTTRSTACLRAPYTRVRTRSAKPVASGTSVSAATPGRDASPAAGRIGRVDLDHHPGYIDKATYERNRERIAANTRPRAHEPGGAVREGQALLHGIAVCGRCGRKHKVHYHGRRGHQSPAYHCPSGVLVENRGSWCVRVGGGRIDQAVAAEALEADHEAARTQWRLQVERARYQAERAERRYSQVEPEHRLVARGLERDWENPLQGLTKAEAELATAAADAHQPRARAAAGARRPPKK